MDSRRCRQKSKRNGRLNPFTFTRVQLRIRSIVKNKMNIPSCSSIQLTFSCQLSSTLRTQRSYEEEIELLHSHDQWENNLGENIGDVISEMSQKLKSLNDLRLSMVKSAC